MSHADVARSLLTMIEGFGLTGSWTWDFEDGRQRWSPGLYRMLGLHSAVSPDYALLHALIHPEDRPGVMGTSELKLAGTLVEQRFRLLRGDGTVCAVASRTETRFSPSGRPLSAAGVLADVGDRDALARSRDVERRRSRALFDAVRAFTSTTWTYPYTDLSEEYVRLVGVPKVDLLANPTGPVVAEERQRWIEHGRQLYLSGGVVHTQPRMRLADGSAVRYRMVMVPVLDENGGIECWSNYVAPLDLPLSAPGRIAQSLERQIGEAHLRAGRALLGWSMADLAAASGLSLSTVRRMEGGGGRGMRSVTAAVAALRRAGVSFTLLPDAGIALNKRP